MNMNKIWQELDTLIEDYNDICLPHTKNICIDNLYFDLNCLIHPCCQKLSD